MITIRREGTRIVLSFDPASPCMFEPTPMELVKECQRLRRDLDQCQKVKRDMEECVDNIREAMGLETTHFLVLPDQVADMRKDLDQALGEAVQFADLVWDSWEANQPQMTEEEAEHARSFVQSYRARQK